MASPTDASGGDAHLLHYDTLATIARFAAFRIKVIDPRYEALLRTIEPDASGSLFVGAEAAPTIAGSGGGAARPKDGAK